jgi:hypothetical protein
MNGSSLLVAFLFLFGLGAIVWLALTRREDTDEAKEARRRTAEDRLRDREQRAVRKLDRDKDER